MILCHKTLIIGLYFFVTLENSHGAELRGALIQSAQLFYATEKENSRNFYRTQLKTRGEIALASNLKFKLDQTTLFSKIEYDNAKYVDASGDQFGLLLSTSHMDFFVGSFTLTPDGPDLNSPFDVINAKDYKQPFQSEPIGSAGVRISAELNTFNIELFYFPKQSRSRLPSLNSIWWPRSRTLPLTNSAGTFHIADNMTYKLKSETELNKPFDHAHGAQLRYTIDELDMYLFYFRGVSQIPLIYPEFNVDVISISPLVGTIHNPIDLNYTWYASIHSGAGASYMVGDWIIKGFFKQQTDKLAIEKKLSSATSVIESSLSLGRLSLRYFLQNNRTWRSDGVSELQTLLGFFDRSTSLGFLLDAENGSLFSGALIYNELEAGLISSLNFEYTWTDQLKTKLTFNSLHPSNDIVGKAYDNIDNAVFTLSYDFSTL